MKRTKITLVNRKNGKKKEVTFVIGKSYKKTKDIKLTKNQIEIEQLFKDVQLNLRKLRKLLL